MFVSSTHVGRIIISVVCSLQLFDRERCVLPCIVWRQLPQEAGLRLFRGPASGVSWAAWKEGPHCLPAVFLHWIWWEHETISNSGMEWNNYLCHFLVMILGLMLLPHQTPTSRKPRSRTLTAEQEGIWAASTQSCRTSRGSWWPI